MDWRAWHDQYDDPGSRLARRLRAVQAQIRLVLGAHRFTGEPRPLAPGLRMFTFIDFGVLRQANAQATDMRRESRADL